MFSKYVNQKDIFHKHSHKLNEDVIHLPDPISKSLNLMSFSAINVFGKLEEQKVNSPKSEVSVSKFVQETNLDIVEHFAHIDYEAPQK